MRVLAPPRCRPKPARPLTSAAPDSYYLVKVNAFIYKRGDGSMRTTSASLARYAEGSAALGGIIWLGNAVLGFAHRSFIGEVAALLSFAFLVIMPFVMRLVVVPLVSSWRDRLGVAVVVAQPFAAVCAGVALLPLAATVRVAGAGIWLLYTMSVAMVGLRLVWRARRDVAAWCRGAALGYVPIGAAWFLAAQAHIAPLGLNGMLVLLTAMHFHYIPLVGLTMTGLVGEQGAVRRQPRGRTIYRYLAGGMLINPLLVALGISLTQLTGDDRVETLAALLQAGTVIVLGVLLLGYAAPAALAPLARVGLFLAGAAVFVSMAAASLFAVGNATGAWAITYPQMLLFHGWVNALCFGACGLCGWLANAHATPELAGEGR